VTSNITTQRDSSGWLDRAGIILSGALLLIAIGVMVAAPWLTWRWAQHPFPAALFGPSYVTSAASPPNWEGARPPAQLQAVDGVRLDTPFALEQEMSHRRAGDRVVLTLKRPNGTQEQVTVTLMQIGPADLFIYMGLPYLVGLAYVAIGAWVYRKRYTQPDGRAFGALCAAVAIVTSAIFENSTTHVLSWLWFAGMPIGSGLMVSLAMVFPQPLGPAKRWPLITWLPGLIGLGVALAALPAIYNLSEPWSYESTWRIGLTYMIVSLIFFYGCVWYHRVRSPLSLVRQQSRVILWGSLLAFGPMICQFGIELISHRVLPIPAPMYVLPMIVWPLALAYAVLRHRLWDIDLLIQRGLVYGTLTVLLGGAYFILLAVLTPALVWLTGQVNNATAVFLATATLALAFTPVRNAIQAALDRTFYRDRLDLHTAQREIGHALSSALTLEDVMRLLTIQMPQRLRLERATLWLKGPAGLLPHPPEAAVAVESAPLAISLGAHGVYAIGMSLADRPPNRDEVDVLTALGDQAIVALENVRLAAQLAARARIEQEMTIARQTQLSLLPAHAPSLPGWDVAGYSQPATEVGGDFYTFHPLPDGGLGLSVGDVSGKGMPAALMMSGLVISLAAACEADPSPGELLERMDRVLQSYRGPSGRNTALCYVRLPASADGPRTLCAANAGMIAPLMRRADGQVAWLNVHGLPLGAPHVEAGYDQACPTLESGDMLVLASDGVIERMNPSGELFGFERFERAVAACSAQMEAGQVCHAILEQVEAFAAPAVPHDDMTLVVARVVQPQEAV